MQSEKKLIAVYGSLRKGEYNYSSRDLNYIKTVTIPGFDLFSLGAYPGIRPGEGNLVIDIMECDVQTKQGIDRMEIRAGYSAESINIDGLNCTIYVYKHDVNPDQLVESGDWTKREVCVD